MSVDVGVDSGQVNSKYYPLTIEDVISWMVKREEEMLKAGRIVEEHGKRMYRQDDVRWALSQKEKEDGRPL